MTTTVEKGRLAVEVGHMFDIRPCLDCQKVHERWVERQVGPIWTWKDKADGHSYRPMDWREFAIALWTEFVT